jgi:transcription antitermination factor NusG
MPTNSRERRKQEEEAAFHVGDIVLVGTGEETAGAVVKVDMERQLLQVRTRIGVSEVPFDSTVLVSRAERERPERHPFERGMVVRIIDGPFADFNGLIDEIFAERKTLRVDVLIFSRSTSQEFEFSQVEPT